jgi:hypothetical protein
MCTYSDDSSETKGLLEEEEDEKSILSFYVKDKTNIFTPGQRSQADKKEQRCYDAFMEKLRKDGGQKLEEIGKTVIKEIKKSEYKFLIDKLGESRPFFNIEDKNDAKSFLRKVFKLEEDASGKLIKQMYSEVKKHYSLFEDYRRLSSEDMKRAFFIMENMADVLGWRDS